MIDNHFKDYYPISNYNEISSYCRAENMDTEYWIGYILLSILIGILYVHTKGNVFAAILFHAMANPSLGLMPLMLSNSGAILLLGVMLAVTVIMIVGNIKHLFSYEIIN